MRPTSRSGGKPRRQFSAETVANVQAIAEGCKSLNELAKRVKGLGISDHDLLTIEQDWGIRFRRGTSRTRRSRARAEFILPRDPTNPGFGRTSPT